MLGGSVGVGAVVGVGTGVGVGAGVAVAVGRGFFVGCAAAGPPPDGLANANDDTAMGTRANATMTAAARNRGDLCLSISMRHHGTPAGDPETTRTNVLTLPT